MDIGKCLNDAVEIYKKNWVQLVVAAIVFEILFCLSLTLLGGVLMGGWSIMVLNAIRSPDQRVEFGDMFSLFRRFMSLTGLFYVTFIPILVGLVLCIVPGLLLMTLWLFAFFFLVDDEDERAMGALSTSQEVVKRDFGQAFLLVIIIFALSIAPSMIPYVGVIVGWFVVPLAWLMEASAYQQVIDSGLANDAE